MSHELTMRRSGKVEMAYTGDIPWHGLGTPVPAGASLEQWRVAAGMEWSIAKTNIGYSYNGEHFDVSDRVILHRDDNGHPLGVVSTSYNVVQPAEVFEFFRDATTALGLSMETAGTLFGGRRFWAMARIGEQALVDDRDKIKGYLLLCTSADGSLRTRGKVTTVRVVCNNTLTAALGNSNEAEVRVSHRAKFVGDDVKAQLGLAPKSFDRFMEDMRALAGEKLTNDAALQMTQDLLGRHDSPSVKLVMERFEGAAVGYDQPGFAGTPWGWLNSVTEFVDHGRKSKSESHKLNTSLFGSGDRLKNRARDMALQLVGVDAPARGGALV